MKISINDVIFELPENSTLQNALELRNISPQGIATALNGTVIPVAARPATPLADGDRIVIIKAFYGG
ncbi:MAG: sulfur carrier protein ThiS [Duncaniella sp.]|uniref:sulfur carrier protein ThiS n=1 Tax=Duncaniella sp. TaxID=2518496 RepID=UPI0023C6EF3D|nr:sulfur carrier protein ThiS [Duncaniella sp.]MDE6089491.1 sulfur carrier protein ThiS [Duncaniella sp.]